MESGNGNGKIFMMISNFKQPSGLNSLYETISAL